MHVRIALAFVLLCALPTTFAGVSPIAGLPNYNATYFGTPGTGNTTYDSLYRSSPIFTTLYRDNYSRESGCAGERCGKHPGVDISVPSGTAALAALAGKVVRSECNSTWGGLVVIEATNPFATSTKVYVSYAHLRSRSVAVNANVSLGQVVGYTGGRSGIDSCAGLSTGAHLHFQVDKPWGGPYPWYPPKDATGNPRVELADADFEVARYTHNPLPFVFGTSGWWNWTFAEDGNKELWQCGGVLCNTANSELWMDGTATYPFAGRSSLLTEVSCTYSDGSPCSGEITLDADIFKKLYLNINLACNTGDVYVWYRNTGDTWYKVRFAYTTAGTYGLNMGGLSSWKGILTDLMIQPSAGCTYYASPYREYYIRQVYLKNN